MQSALTGRTDDISAARLMSRAHAKPDNGLVYFESAALKRTLPIFTGGTKTPAISISVGKGKFENGFTTPLLYQYTYTARRRYPLV